MGADITAEEPAGALPLYDAQSRINVLAPQASILAGTAPKRFGSDDDLNVLVLSGGGSNGAYGAGVLYGWTQSGKRPGFDVVTGVSTGALIAPLAFAGPAYDEELRRFYTQIHDRDIFRDRGLRGLLSNAVLSSAPLRARIAEVVTPGFLDLIAAEQKKGRRLYIASTDLDQGESVVWDMGGLAASDLPDKRDSGTKFFGIAGYNYLFDDVVLGLEAPSDELAASFAVAARHDLVKGFAVGRTIFQEPAAAWLAGGDDDAALKRAVRANFEALIDAWQEART